MPVWFSRALCWLLISLVAAPPAVSAQDAAVKRLKPGEFLLAETLPPGLLKQDAPSDSALQIIVIEGEDGINIIKKKTAVMPVVEVRDRNKQPLAGVALTFTTPQNGPSAVFMNGAHVGTLTTDATGRAAIVGMKPVAKGTFAIQVTALYQGLTASATIHQRNVMTAGEAAAAQSAAGAAGTGGGAGLSHGALLGIILGGVGAAAIGGILATRGKSSSGGSSASVLTATIGLGSTTPTVTTPH